MLGLYREEEEGEGRWVGSQGVINNTGLAMSQYPHQARSLSSSSSFFSLVLTRRRIEGGCVIVRHVIRESAVGRPFPVTVVSIINFRVVVVAVDSNVIVVVVFQVLTAGLAAIDRRQTAANSKYIFIQISGREGGRI
jgi:hypothetical protein